MKPLLQGVALIGAVGSGAWGQELVAHWTMDEVEVADATGNGHDATWGEARAEVVDGLVGGALNFEAEKEHYLQVAESSDFNFTGPFTVMAWVKPTRRNAAFAIACMKGDKSGDPPWPGWRLRFFWARAMLQVGTPDGLEPSVSSEEWSVPVGYWTHVAASWDGEQLRIFTNAVERAATEFSGEIAPQPRPLIIGNYIGRKNAYAFDGLIDDVRIYDGALTEDEVFTAARPQ
ncbi:MAG TPA: LamG domain-containing protein [Armatimonadota bacterium]|nr:LamG domain-containing protein [Armatimonadota bacterium]